VTIPYLGPEVDRAGIAATIQAINQLAPAPTHAVGPTLYDELLKRAVTAFYLPIVPNDDPLPVEIGPTDKEEYLKKLDAVLAIPFPCIRIIRDTRRTESELWNHKTWKHVARGRSDTICEVRDDKFAWASRDQYWKKDGTTWVVYTPEQWAWDPRTIAVPKTYFALMEALANRQNRFVEQPPPSRQVRRHLGLQSEYREYIVVRKREAPKEALTLGQIIRRHPILHAVRGHLRHYKGGLVVKVRPHCRGTGTHLQVKDYVLPVE